MNSWPRTATSSIGEVTNVSSNKDFEFFIAFSSHDDTELVTKAGPSLRHLIRKILFLVYLPDEACAIGFGKRGSYLYLFKLKLESVVKR